MSNPLESLNQYINTNKKQEKYIEINFDNDPRYNKESLLYYIKNINSLSDKEAYDIVKNGYEFMLNEIFEESDKSYINLFLNERFLVILIQVISSDVITNQNIIRFNKIFYQYITTNSIYKDPKITNLLLTLAKMVNKVQVNRLLILGIDEYTSIRLCVGRYSSFKEAINIARMNLFLLYSNIINEQILIDLYGVLFDNLGLLFTTTMYDVYTDEELESISDTAGDVYSSMSLALIDILNTMPSKDIRGVLLMYASEYNTDIDKQKVRFSMYNISKSEYERIYIVMENMKSEDIYVP